MSISPCRPKDIGKPKALVAASFVMERVAGVQVTPYVQEVFDTSNKSPCSYHRRIQDFDDEFYRQFALVICGLDSIEARRWMNATLIRLYDPKDPSTTIPMIDGGTEGDFT